VLYDLVCLRNSLTAAFNADGAVNELQDLCQRLHNVKIELPNTPPEHTAYIDSLVQRYEQLIVQIKQPVDEFDLQLQTINDQITQLSHLLFANNYDLEEHYGNIDHVRANRCIHVDPEVQQIIQQRIFVHTNWRYPALEIGCRDGEWTQYLVAADPLYIMDRLPEFLDITNDRFTPEYQQRLRKYPLIDHNLSALPQHQIGFAFSWGYFNFISVDTMHQVLKQMRNVLRPGGVFMFSYNDGDTAVGAGMAENFAQSYMPRSLLVTLCLSLGFEIVNEVAHAPNISWIEIRRPGTLHTVKAHQVFGEIRNRPGLE
jgi:SAM-dependent methyltransferase